MTRFGLLCLLCISSASAQGIWVGVKGGLPLSQAFDAIENSQPLTVIDFYQNSPGIFDYDSATRRTVPYTIGPAVEIRLWRHIRAEVDGFYSRAVFDYTSVRFNKFDSNSDFADLKYAVDRVDMPVLVKYEFVERRRFHLFAGAGVSTLYSRDKVLQGIADAAVPGGGPGFWRRRMSSIQVRPQSGWSRCGRSEWVRPFRRESRLPLGGIEHRRKSATRAIPVIPSTRRRCTPT